MGRLRELTLEITKQCPLDCMICSSNSGDKKDSNELSFEQLKKLIDDSLELGLETLSLSGGEPLVSENCLPLLDYVKLNNLNIDLYSSGNLYGKDSNTYITKEIGEQLADRISRIIFSIHGPDPEML